MTAGGGSRCKERYPIKCKFHSTTKPGRGRRQQQHSSRRSSSNRNLLDGLLDQHKKSAVFIKRPRESESRFAVSRNVAVLGFFSFFVWWLRVSRCESVIRSIEYARTQPPNGASFGVKCSVRRKKSKHCYIFMVQARRVQKKWPKPLKMRAE